ncbi:hypothetical protein BDY24DRAFT_435608 [Mrakia frigida]|uniref:uncharacterized protein n=1 Tax=Mrakia frigida TaxID=29902 RepID=UPI003FCBFAA2
MSSYQSSSDASSFGGRSSSSDFATSPVATMGAHMAHLDNINEGEEPLDHPVLSSYHRETVVPDRWGNTLMQTKSAWEKQMKAFDKEDAKKQKKEARKAKNHPMHVIEGSFASHISSPISSLSLLLFFHFPSLNDLRDDQLRQTSHDSPPILVPSHDSTFASRPFVPPFLTLLFRSFLLFLTAPKGKKEKKKAKVRFYLIIPPSRRRCWPAVARADFAASSSSTTSPPFPFSRRFFPFLNLYFSLLFHSRSTRENSTTSSGSR